MKVAPALLENSRQDPPDSLRFCLGDGLAQLVLCENGKTCVDVLSLGRDRVPKELTPFSTIITGADIACLMASCVGYLVICLAIEYGQTSPKLLGWLRPDPKTDRHSDTDPEEDDEDVAAEARRVEEMEGVLRDGEGGGEGPKVAVQGLSFSVARGDCFGFLGINGAGEQPNAHTSKESTHVDKMFSARKRGRSGNAGRQVPKAYHNYQRQYGADHRQYGEVEEHLLLYARIKGVNENRIGHVAGEKMQQMDLTPFRETKAFELSGGNKRKLSVAIAMIGDPRVVFLDEPSTGMDPIARRFMWDIISRMTTTDRECSVILTTHSMEEAESLCNNIGIMVNGRLRCLGSTQHLKHRFGSGFEADMKLQPPSTAAATEVMQLLMAHGVANIIGDDIDSSRLWGPLDICCDGLARGDFDRAEALETALKCGSGAFLQDVLGSEGGTLPTRLFIDWYLCEQRADNLNDFLEETFPGAELVERPTLFSCRYKIPYQDGMKLADVFEHFEAAKAKLGLASYAVGQTTLEQIFNSLAVTKDNPEVRLRQTSESEDAV
ncbi:ABC [Ectocarpus sp. CCAP 1310/34]|nr:ABC [Ectocarpus sp. CCAP 1310/34]